MEEILTEIGLNKSEIKVYLTLLDLGESTRGNIVKQSHITGSKVYDILAKLEQKGLIAIYHEHNIKHFKAISPKQILHYIKEKQEALKHIEEKTQTILPELLAKFNSNKNKKEEVELLYGQKGLQIFFNEQLDLLKSKETCYVIGGTNNLSDSLTAFFKQVHMRREQQNIKTKMLYNRAQKEAVERHYSSKQYPNTTTHFIDHNSPVALNIYKDRTAIIIFGHDIVTISIKSKIVSQSFKEYFDILWK